MPNIKVQVEALSGEMLKDMEKNKGAKGSKVSGNQRIPVKDVTPTLTNMGISYKQSSNWQKIAEIPEAEFEKDKTGHVEP